ncbi:YegP family protein [Fibrella aquatilis]|uniref:YegP family protein n=1 Tax=Fibrella aquatilis TaxID=2817059 RepID=A0A939G629_9BACT|nr:YegP family protein [Fibrella aquatilis]MBO0930468.1 YegP family protein [Fibrella aquatilis]
MNRFRLIKAGGGYSFSLLAHNGEVILTSKLYETKQDCDQALDSLLHLPTDTFLYDKKTDAEEFHYFVLKDRSGSILATSDKYASISGLENGIYSVKQAIADAFVYS